MMGEKISLDKEMVLDVLRVLMELEEYQGFMRGAVISGFVQEVGKVVNPPSQQVQASQPPRVQPQAPQRPQNRPNLPISQPPPPKRQVAPIVGDSAVNEAEDGGFDVEDGEFEQQNF